MTAATYRDSAPVAAPAIKPAVIRKKGFWARLFNALVEARQREVEDKIARYQKEGRVPFFYL